MILIVSLIFNFTNWQEGWKLSTDLVRHTAFTLHKLRDLDSVVETCFICKFLWIQILKACDSKSSVTRSYVVTISQLVFFRALSAARIFQVRMRGLYTPQNCRTEEFYLP